MTYAKQSTAVTLLIGPFLDSTDGNTAETALTIAQADVYVSKNGGTMAAKNDVTSCTHDALGYYTCPLDATDTNTLGILKIMVHPAGALPVWIDATVVTANVYDTLFGTDQLDVNVTNIAGIAQTANDNGADINAILADTDELQINQGNWLTATGFSTHSAADVWAVTTRTLSSFGTLVADIWANITRTLTAGTKDTEIDAIKAVTDVIPDSGAMTSIAQEATINALNDISAADVNAEVVDALNVDTYAEPAQGAPPATASIVTKISHLYKAWRNKKEETATETRIYDDAGTVVDHKRTVSDDGTTATAGEWITGP